MGLSLSSCAVGPDFKPPVAPEARTYAQTPFTQTVAVPGIAGGEAQSLAQNQNLPSDWWNLFHSRRLSDLTELAIRNNHDLKAAQAALAVAKETTLAQRGGFLPSISAGFSATSTKTSSALAPTPSTNASQYSLYTPQVSIAYAPDVFGLNRRAQESLAAQEEASRYQMAATYLALTSNVANAVIQAGALQSEIKTTRDMIAVTTKIVETLNYQFQKGYASRADLAAEEAQLAQVSATLPPLLTQLNQQKDLLATLTGQYPGQGEGVGDLPDLSDLTLPTDLPLSLPARLVSQRPDVLQAEANMQSSSALIGVAIANRLPNLQLTGDAGSSGLALHDAFGPGGGFWDLGAAITAPVFQGGTLLHQERAAKSAYVQATEQYRSTVLGAMQSVADTLSALEHDAETLKAAAAATQAAKVSLDISERQFQAGYAANLTLLNAQQTYQQAQITLIQAQASRYADTTALFLALGGGWWQRSELTGKQDGH